LEPLGTAEFANSPVMMMANSSSRLGLCITVRPDSHKAESVEDLRPREKAKYLFKIFSEN